MPTPRLLTPEVHEAIVESIRGGNYVETAAGAAGIHRKTFYEWMKIGEADDAPEPYASFAAAVRVAENEAEADAVKILKAAQFDDWKAAEVFLKRRHPTKWGDKVETTHAGEIAIKPDAIRDRVRSIFGANAAPADAGSNTDPATDSGGTPAE